MRRSHLHFLGGSVSSTENNVSKRLVKVWTAIDISSIIWKSDLSDKIKWDFFQAVAMSVLLYGCVSITVWMHHKDTHKMHGEGVKWELSKNAISYFEQFWKQYSCCTATYLPSHIASKSDEQDMKCTVGEASTNSKVTFFYKPLYMDVSVLADNQ